MNGRAVAGVVGGLLIVIVVAVSLLTGGDDEETPRTPSPSGPTAVLTEDAPTPDVPDSGETVDEQTREAQFEAARAYVTNYYQYSYRDSSPSAWMGRVKPHMTDDHWHVLEDLFGDADADMSNAWDEVRRDRKTVTVNIVETLHDPWYDPKPDEAAVAVRYTMSTSSAGATGTGPEQVARLMVVKSGDRFLVSDELTEGQ